MKELLKEKEYERRGKLFKSDASKKYKDFLKKHKVATFKVMSKELSNAQLRRFSLLMQEERVSNRNC